MNKTIYYLRIRESDKESWGDPIPFTDKVYRDAAVAIIQSLYGFDTDVITKRKISNNEKK